MKIAKWVGSVVFIASVVAVSACRNSDGTASAAPNNNVPTGGGPTTNMNAPPAAATGGLNAQNTVTPGASLMEPARPAPPSAPMEMAQGGGPLHFSDGDIAAVTSTVNHGEIEQGQVARTRARNPEVRTFADQMIQQHQQLIQQQTQLLGQIGVTPVQNDTAHRLTQEGQSTMQSLQSATPDNFDRTYIDAQVREHEETLHAFDSMLIPSAQNAQLRQSLVDARAMVQHHLVEARRIQQTLASGATGTPPSGGAMPGGAGMHHMGAPETTPVPAH